MRQPFSLTFFDDETCARVLRELRETGGAAATVYGSSPSGAVQTSARKTTKLQPSAELRALVRARLDEVRESLEQHFEIVLGEPEEAQFLRYDVGDYFVAHQDGNTPLVRDASLSRRVSISIFLNSGYRGGSLVLHGAGNERTIVDALPGSAIAFRSETTHEVTPLTEGVRFTIVTWFPARA